jgi:hypothetical protein
MSLTTIDNESDYGAQRLLDLAREERDRTGAVQASIDLRG